MYAYNRSGTTKVDDLSVLAYTVWYSIFFQLVPNKDKNYLLNIPYQEGIL